MNHELEELVRQLPRPRGEGFSAWVRYYALKTRNVWDGSRDCLVHGCPNRSVGPSVPWCMRHFRERVPRTQPHGPPKA